AAPPDADLVRRWELAQVALRRALDVMLPGKPASGMAEAVQATFRDAGYRETPHHQSGYSIGISFAPHLPEARSLSLRRGNAMLLEEGMTLFPIANCYGPRTTMADSCMAIVRPGGPEVLTKFRPEPGDLAL